MKYFICFFLFLFSFTTFAGGCGGHGGDSYSLEFYRIGKYLAQEFTSWRPEDFSKLSIKFNPKQFEFAVENTRIVSTANPLILLDREVDAINRSSEGSNIIELNRIRWDSQKQNRLLRMGIVLHEYLGIQKSLFGSGEWDNYVLSSQLLDLYEARNVLDSRVNFKRQRSTIAARFAESKVVPDFHVSSSFPLSCVEYSALEDDSSTYVHFDSFILKEKSNQGKWMSSATQRVLDTHIERVWRDEDPTEKIDTPKSLIKEYIRQTPDGDLISEVTTDYKYEGQPASSIDPKRGVLSYFYCSRLGSQTQAMTKYMYDSLTPILDLPNSSNYEKFLKEHKKLANGSSFKKCLKGDNSNCLKLIKKMDNFTLADEAILVANAKQNIKGINEWLDKLDHKSNATALKPLSDLYTSFVAHQNYVQGLLNFRNPDANQADFGLGNFLEGLETRLPKAYETAKYTFSKELEDIQMKSVRSFQP